MLLNRDRHLPGHNADYGMWSLPHVQVFWAGSTLPYRPRVHWLISVARYRLDRLREERLLGRGHCRWPYGLNVPQPERFDGRSCKTIWLQAALAEQQQQLLLLQSADEVPPLSDAFNV